MTQIYLKLRPAGWMALLTLTMLFWTGCNAGSLATEDPEAPVGSQVLASMDFVESVEMTVYNPGVAKEEQFLLSIRVDDDSHINYPEAFNVFGMSNDGTVTRMSDAGSGVDSIEGDGVYSAWVDRSCLEDDAMQQFAGKDIVKFTLTCEIDFVSPGESCEGEGVCPETASRSWLWGLIEYDVEVVTCWCFQGCDVDVSLSLGKDNLLPTDVLDAVL